MVVTTERIILNYIVQIRKPFSLQQVVDDTGLAKTSCFRVFRKLLKEKRIFRTRAGRKPKLYRYSLEPAVEFLNELGGRREEVRVKAAKLGVSTRTIYRIEDRVAAGLQDDPFLEEELEELPPHLEKVMKEINENGKISIKKTARLVGLNAYQAYEILCELEGIKLIKQEGNYYVPIRKVS